MRQTTKDIMLRKKVLNNESKNEYLFTGLRRDTMDSSEDRVRDLPPRGGHQGGQGGSGGGAVYGGRQGGGGRPSAQRRDRRDDRRRTTDDEDTVLDSQDVSSIDRGKRLGLNELFMPYRAYVC
jgi:hypothetical protein